MRKFKLVVIAEDEECEFSDELITLEQVKKTYEEEVLNGEYAINFSIQSIEEVL
jgi:hypothetical protein